MAKNIIINRECLLVANKDFLIKQLYYHGEKLV